MRKFFVVGLAALLVIGVVGAVAVANAADDGVQVAPPGTQAPPAWGHRDDKSGPPMFGLALGLNQQQLDSLNNLRQEQSKATQDLMQQVRDLQSQYQEALQNNDTKQIASLRDQFGAVQDQMTQLRDDYKAKMLDVLTPEQQQLLDKYKGQGPFGGFGRLGRFGPRGRGFGHPDKSGPNNGDTNQSHGL